MSFDFGKIFIKDSIKFNCLREILAGKIKLAFTLKNSTQDYASEIHSEQSRVKVYGNFNISEDPSGEILTVRVVMIDSPLKISLSFLDTLSGKKISLFRSATKSTEKEHELTNRTQVIEFIPGQENYLIKIQEAPINPTQLQNEISEIKSRVESDEGIIKYYDNTQSITEILNEIKPKLSEAESQIRKLIEARESQTARIESAVK